MKYIKLFEDQINEPEVGDYVICEEKEVEPALIDFLKNNIGKIKQHFPGTNYPYIVYFENLNLASHQVMQHISDQSRNYRLNEIKHFSKNKEDLEYIIQANKYNL